VPPVIVEVAPFEFAIEVVTGALFAGEPVTLSPSAPPATHRCTRRSP
jgi:hypothetical protein